MTTCASTETACEKAARLLDEAQAAMHDLMIGGQAVKIAAGGGDKVVEYSPANRGALAAYIAQLQRQVDACNGCRHRGRAVQFIPV